MNRFRRSRPVFIASLPWAPLLVLASILWGHGVEMLAAISNTLPAGIAADARGAVQAQELIPLTQVWAYDQSGRDLGTGWREAGFDDAAWAAGPAVLAHEENAAVTPMVRTELLLMTNGMQTITYYFRTRFDVATTRAGYFLSFSNLVDDGAVVYLNGTELFRQNMPTGPVDWQTRASHAIAVNREGIFSVTPVAAADRLVSGENVLAVEVHQSDASSTDVTFGLVLGYVPQVPLSVVRSPASVTMNEGKTTILETEVAGSLPQLQWFCGGSAIPGATSPQLVLTNTPRAAAGHYHCVASNALGAVTTAVATVTVVLDEVGPALEWALWHPTNSIELRFSDELNPDAADPAHFEVVRADTGEAVAIGAVQVTSPRTVWLTVSALPAGTTYIVTARGLSDRYGNGMPTDGRASLATPQVLFPLEAEWRYEDSGVDLGTAWREAAYNDSAWAAGPAALYNDENLNLPPGVLARTPIRVLNSSGVGIVTHYFRRRFQLQATPIDAQLRLRFAVDDGAVFYVNGSELGRVNLPAGSLYSGTRASVSVQEGILQTNLFAATNLVAGDNELAVEVHQYSLTSPSRPDVVFALEPVLEAVSYAGLPPVVLQEPADLLLEEFETATWTPVLLGAESQQWFRNGVAIPGATAPTLVLDSVSATDDGAQFRLVVSNVFGASTSRVAQLKVLPDVDPPQLLDANMGVETNRVRLSFSEPLDPSSATDLAHYGITNQLGEPLALVSAVLTNGTNVLLFTQPRTAGFHYHVSVRGVRDMAVRANAVFDQRPVGYEVLCVPWTWPWRYDESGQDLGLAWREPAFDDTAWPTGPGLLGFEETATPEPIETVLTPPEYRGPVYYFRTHFAFTPVAEADAIWLRLIVDDGAVFFLNGVEVYRVGVPADQNFQTLSTRVVEAQVEGPVEIPAGALLAGHNVLAAETHQVSPASADIVFGAQVTVAFDMVPPAVERPRLRFHQSGGVVELRWAPGDAILECAESLGGPWLRAPQPTIPYRLPAMGASQFYRLAGP